MVMCTFLLMMLKVPNVQSLVLVKENKINHKVLSAKLQFLVWGSLASGAPEAPRALRPSGLLGLLGLLGLPMFLRSPRGSIADGEKNIGKS